MRSKKASLLVLIGIAIAGCGTVGVVGMSQSIARWEEQTFPSRVDRDTAFRAAATSLAKVGKLQSSDATGGVVNGECKQFVDAGVFVDEREGRTYVTVKSRYNVEAGALVIDDGSRSKCVERITQELRSAGVIGER